MRSEVSIATLVSSMSSSANFARGFQIEREKAQKNRSGVGLQVDAGKERLAFLTAADGRHQQESRWCDVSG